jgi:hypothetical protein
MFQKVKQTFNEKPKFSIITLSVFVVVFVAIGSYFIYQSLASQEAEIAADKETKKIETLTEHLKADSAAYKSTMPTEQKPKLEDIKKTAQERKQEMKRLATADPDTFLVNAIRKEEKEALVEDVKAYVEDQVTVTGKYTGEKVTIGNKQYNLRYNKNYPIYIDLNTETEFYGYTADNDLIVSATPNIGYKENTKLDSPKDPKGKVKFEGTVTADMPTGVTTDTAVGAEGEVIIPGVPAYRWRDGCGPTSAGMAVGYWDSHGYDNLIEGTGTPPTQGDTSTGVDPVNQMIATHGTTTAPVGHWEDYAIPMEVDSTILPDKSELPAGDEHTSNSVADFAHTSWSIDRIGYGGTYVSQMPASFVSYVKSKYPDQLPSSKYLGGPSTTPNGWEAYKAEIDANRPTLFIVDSSGDGRTDHASTGIGYREINGYPEYAVWDTWSRLTIRWAQWRPITSTYSWGVYGVYAVNPTGGVPAPTISSFAAEPTTVESGKPVTLSWTTTNATSAYLTPWVYDVPVNGSYTVTPTATTTYTLKATNSAGSVTASLTVTVTPPITPPPPPADTTAPAVSLSGLTNLATYSSGRYTVTGNATDASGIAKIEIIVSGKVMATCSNVTTCSYTLNIKKLAVGTHTIAAKAYDKAGNASSNSLMITRVK